jgi:hypothetical protein
MFNESRANVLEASVKLAFDLCNIVVVVVVQGDIIFKLPHAPMHQRQLSQQLVIAVLSQRNLRNQVVAIRPGNVYVTP